MNRFSRMAAIGIAFLGVAALAPRAKADDFRKTYDVSGHPTVHVVTDDGSVRVFTGDSRQVDFHVIYEGYKLDKDIRITANQSGDTVGVEARTGNHWCIFCGGMHHKLQIEVHMPKNADLKIDTGDGSVDTQAVNGNLRIHTGDGSVRAEAASGTISIESGDGSITLTGAKGDIRLHTGDGHIEGRDLDGRVDASSGDGHITVAGRFDALSIKTGDGSINARANSGSQMASSWTIHTGDGSVDLAIPGDLKADIDASTHDGRISLGIPVTVEGTFSTSQIRGKMNGGGQPLTVHTGDGSIRLSKTS